MRAWLRHADHVRILHLFDTACNLIAADGSVLSVVTERIGNGPFNVVVPPVRFTDHVTPAAPVRCSQHALHIGSLGINLNSAVAWNPRPNWPLIRQRRRQLLAHRPVLCEVLQRHAPPDSLARYVVDLPGIPSPITANLLQSARTPAIALVRGLRRGDRGVCLASASQLAGLGGGLTPSGDDWLVGCVLAAYAGLASDEALPLACRAALTAAPRTTPLSVAWLRAAATGTCSAGWHTLFDCCLGKDESAVYRAALQLVRQGHTSGSDALAGFAAVLG
ncbi:MAG: DUF2877 domain-containing protein [Anaerolineae bacterium]|nr:DUF2877 domain-containing protein [Anaerolineae bacterium]